MTNRKWAFLTTTMLLAAFAVVPSLYAQFENDAKWVPNNANSLVLVNSAKIFNSELATQNNWKAKGEAAFESGSSIVPTNVNRLLIASQIDFQFMHTLWDVCVFSKDQQSISLDKIAKKLGTQIEQVANRNALVLPNDAYLVQIDDTTVATMNDQRNTNAPR